MTTYRVPQTQQGIDGMALVACLLILFGGIMLYRDFKVEDMGKINIQVATDDPQAGNQETNADEVGSGHEPSSIIDNGGQISAIYDNYTVTQGPHGFSYGHMAIDLSAGKGGIIKSPIHGYVADRYVDQYGNPTLVLENDFYRVTLLHGKYKVEVGEEISLGQMIGRESNLGLTTDLQGRSCRNRDCGYHSHLNIFDKFVGENVNPLEVISP
jgi:hypothetical protein